jgi:hypothetical protein
LHGGYWARAPEAFQKSIYLYAAIRR